MRWTGKYASRVEDGVYNEEKVAPVLAIEGERQGGRKAEKTLPRAPAGERDVSKAWVGERQLQKQKND